jgi:hypothetical protein
VVLLVGVAGPATCRPSWYQPAAIDHARLKADQRDFVHLVDSIGAALNAGREIVFEVDERQLNRWIAAGGELWPGAANRPDGVETPYAVLLDGGRVRVGAVLQAEPFGAVVSATGRCRIGPDELGIEIESVRCGVLPVPRGWVLSWLRDVAATSRSGAGRVSDAFLWLPNYFVWENGRRPFRVRELAVSRGRARVALEPTGHRR